MPFWRACEDTGVVVGMHTFIAQGQGDSSGRMYSPGELSMRMAQATGVRQTMDSQEISFMYEAITWTNGVLLSGFLDRFPRLKMAIFESNATWLPFLLDRIDRVHRLTPPQQRLSQRLPSEAFREQMMIAFEGDEEPVFRMWDYFEDHAIWSSDHYHHDAMDAWTALGVIEKTGGVPQEVVEKLMGGNARRFYGIEPKLYVTEQRDLDRPGWWPTPEQVDAASTPEAAVDAGLRFRVAGGARSLHEQPDQYLPYHRKKPTERV
jgi:predicted TIM-barrel fold metal-dependent hydrolase